jgi:hypothetical protein
VQLAKPRDGVSTLVLLFSLETARYSECKLDGLIKCKRDGVGALFCYTNLVNDTVDGRLGYYKYCDRVLGCFVKFNDILSLGILTYF